MTVIRPKFQVRTAAVQNPVKYHVEIEVHPGHWETIMRNSMYPKLFDTPEEALQWGEALAERISDVVEMRERAKVLESKCR